MLEMKFTQLIEHVNGLSIYPHYDSGVLYDTGNTINKILMALDYDVSLHDYAKSNEYDGVLIHHSLGQYYYTAYKGVINRLSIIRESGIEGSEYEYLVRQDLENCFLQMRNANMIKLLPLLNSDKLSCAITHHVPDFLMFKKICSIVDKTNNISCLSMMLYKLIEDIVFFPKNESITIYSKTSYYKRPLIDICFVSPPSSIIQKKLLEDGIDLLIVTSTTYEIIDYALKNNKTIILLNHIPFDYLGMKLLKSNLEQSFPITIDMYEQ